MAGKGVGLHGLTEDDTFVARKALKISGARNKARIISGYGNPNGVRYAPTGSLYLRHDTGEAFINTSPNPGGFVWTKLDLGGTPGLCDDEPQDVGCNPGPGISDQAARCDHSHFGTRTVKAGPGVVVTGECDIPGDKFAGDVEVAADLSDTIVDDIACLSSPGGSDLVSRADHTHRGVRSVGSSDGSVDVQDNCGGTGSGDVDLSVTPDSSLGPTTTFINSGDGLLGANTTRYLGVGAFPLSNTENDTVWVVTRAGVLRRLVVRAGSNTRASATTVTVRRNGVATGITLTIPAGSTATVSDLVNTQAVALGDRISVEVVTGAGGGTISQIAASVEETLA